MISQLYTSLVQMSPGDIVEETSTGLLHLVVTKKLITAPSRKKPHKESKFKKWDLAILLEEELHAVEVVLCCTSTGAAREYRARKFQNVYTFSNRELFKIVIKCAQ